MLKHLFLSSLFVLYSATCFAQPTDADEAVAAALKLTFQRRLAEISFQMGVSLPETAVRGKEEDCATVLLLHNNGRVTGVRFNRLGQAQSISSQVGPLSLSHSYGSSGLDAENRREVWKVLDALPNSLDETIPNDRRLFIVGLRQGRRFGALLDRSKLDETTIDMLRRLPPLKGLGYLVPIVESSIQSLGERSLEPLVAGAANLDGFVYANHHELHNARWPDANSSKWSDVTIWRAPEHESICGCDVSPDGQRWMIQTLNLGKCRIHVGERQGLDAFKFKTVVDVSTATCCKFAANHSFAISIDNFHDGKRSFHRLTANDEASGSAETLPSTLYNLSVDGRWGVCHDTSGDVVLRDLRQQQPPRVIEPGVKEITCAEFSPDGRRLLLSTQKKGARDFDSSLWKCVIYDVEHLDRAIDVFEYGVARVRLLEAVWSADSKTIFGRHLSPDLLTGHNRIHVWNASNGKHIAHLAGGGSTSTIDKNRRGLALCDGERRLVAGTPEGTALTWDLRSVLSKDTE